VPGDAFGRQIGQTPLSGLLNKAPWGASGHCGRIRPAAVWCAAWASQTRTPRKPGTATEGSAPSTRQSFCVEPNGTRISRKSKSDFTFHLKKSTLAAIPEGQAGPGHVIVARCGRQPDISCGFPSEITHGPVFGSPPPQAYLRQWGLLQPPSHDTANRDGRLRDGRR
jgi:hypothetical protein